MDAKYRIEHDTMGEVKVPADKYWGAQTQRSFENFKIGKAKMPAEIIRAFGVLKKAAALANARLGMIDNERADLIARVCDEIMEGKLNDHFPLVVYQTGSGTQSNMNVNEVVANRGNQLARGARQNAISVARDDGQDAITVARDDGQNAISVASDDGQNAISVARDDGQDAITVASDDGQDAISVARDDGQDAITVARDDGVAANLLHPNDHVNKSQSSNDTFPTAMHIAAVTVLREQLLPAVQSLRETFASLEAEYMDIVKTGRTHLQDATPLTLGQEISGWRSMLDHCQAMIEASIPALSELALGGTAVGTGLNAHRDFGVESAKEISRITGYEFETAHNKFHSLTSKDALVFAHGAIKALAADLMKIANDIRWLASGPRCGIGEINIPENEPGSSIMPGKVNPTQCEAVTMACVQVMGNDVTIGIAASQGNFQLNVFMPVMINSFLESAELLADAMNSFEKNCVRGITPNYEKIESNMEKSLMLVTALNPHIGYENAAKIAKLAHKENITLKQAALKLGLVAESDFDAWVVPGEMVHPK